MKQYFGFAATAAAIALFAPAPSAQALTYVYADGYNLPVSVPYYENGSTSLSFSDSYAYGGDTTVGYAISADLASGVLRSKTSVDGYSSSTFIYGVGFSDSFLINETFVGTIPITLSLDVDGLITGTNVGAGWAYAVLNANGQQDSFGLAGPYVSDQAVVSTLVSELLSVTFLLSDANPTIDFSAFLYSGGQLHVGGTPIADPGTINADLGNTARLSITLPRGFTFLSESGVLLTNARDVAAAPLPAGLLLLGSALGGAGIIGWRRKGKPDCARS